MDVAIGARIKAVRLAQNPPVSLVWMAREMGCTVQQLHKYETGENRIVFSRLCEIANVLGVHLIDLVGPVLPKRRGP
jgi:transcriptional regulator with XRE-family HTH domain